MKYRFYKLTCLTNLHMGSGDINYDVIDLAVERDPVTKEPTMNASGVKGALRDYFEGTPVNVEKIFGSEGRRVDEQQPDGTTKKVVKPSERGTHEFFGADLIARPVRVSQGVGSFALATTPELLTLLRNKLLAFGIRVSIPAAFPDVSGSNVYVAETNSSTGIEGNATTKATLALEELIGKNWALMSASTLSEIDLPVFAHNVLENGISKNLWYEQMVPHESIFGMIVGFPSEEDDLKLDGKVVQFGAGATTGNGFVLIKEVR